MPLLATNVSQTGTMIDITESRYDTDTKTSDEKV